LIPPSLPSSLPPSLPPQVLEYTTEKPLLIFGHSFGAMQTVEVREGGVGGGKKEGSGSRLEGMKKR